MSMHVDSTVLAGLGLSTPVKTPGPNTEMGQDVFLKLVIAQLQNQDPMKPMENGAFLSQLAQFQSVTGIDDLRKSVDAMAGTFQSNQALQASSLVGRWVMVSSDQGSLWKDSGMAGSVEVPSSSSQVMVSIKDSSGQTIKQIDLGRQEKGVVNFSWDGGDGNGNVYAPGKYSIEALANIGGEFESITTNTVVPVDSVIMGRPGTDLTVNAVGIGRIKLSDVKQIM